MNITGRRSSIVGAQGTTSYAMLIVCGVLRGRQTTTVRSQGASITVKHVDLAVAPGEDIAIMGPTRRRQRPSFPISQV